MFDSSNLSCRISEENYGFSGIVTISRQVRLGKQLVRCYLYENSSFKLRRQLRACPGNKRRQKQSCYSFVARKYFQFLSGLLSSSSLVEILLIASSLTVIWFFCCLPCLRGTLYILHLCSTLQLDQTWNCTWLLGLEHYFCSQAECKGPTTPHLWFSGMEWVW